MDIKKTSLHAQHVELNAKMADFAGFDMPLQYSSVKEEVLAVRENAGVFDVSHMGEFFVEGKEAIKFVDNLISNDFIGAGNSKAVYSPLCRDNGTIIDDLIAYKLEEEKVLICVNAANIEKDWNWISSKVEEFDCTLTDRSSEYSLLALQGPKTEEILKKIGFSGIEDIEYYSIKENDFKGNKVIMARTGYTGEDGFELFCSHETVKELWKDLLDNGVSPCGLVSRDVLRLEVCYPLYGNELNDELTPLDAALKWTVKMSKDNFFGKNALEEYTPKYRLAKLILEKGIPREGYPVENSDGETIGVITSGTMSVTINKGIALARVEKSKFPKDKKLFIKVRKNAVEATYTTKPFVTGGHK